MPKTVKLTEQEWEEFLHQIDIWHRRRIYRHEIALFDRLQAGEITRNDILEAIDDDENEAALAALAFDHSKSEKV